jgi:hypothetical protein
MQIFKIDTLKLPLKLNLDNYSDQILVFFGKTSDVIILRSKRE